MLACAVFRRGDVALRWMVPANITDEVAGNNCYAPGCENFIAVFSLLNRPGTITVLEAYVAPEPVRRMRVIL